VPSPTPEYLIIHLRGIKLVWLSGSGKRERAANPLRGKHAKANANARTLSFLFERIVCTSRLG
jgi:hypothetical protein